MGWLDKYHKAQAGITKAAYKDYQEEEAKKHPPLHAPLELKDNRKISATTNKPINPNVDLIGGTYDLNRMDNIINYAKNKGLEKEDAWNLMAMELQETKWGKTDDQTGHVKDSNGGANNDEIFVNAYINKMKRADELGINDPNKRLQVYNGTGSIKRTTESKYHGFDMQKAYGVPIPKEGINMMKNPLYGKRITDYKENVLKKNERVQKYVDSTYAAPKYDVNKHLHPIEEPTPWELDMKKQFEDEKLRQEQDVEFRKNEPINGVKKKAQHGIIQDDRGQWAHPGEITKINSNNITMKGVDYPVYGVSDTGDSKLMWPGQDYKFDGGSVTEYPMAKKGAWLDKYQNGDTFEPLTTGVNELQEIQITGRTTDEARAEADPRQFVGASKDATNINRPFILPKTLNNLPTQSDPGALQELQTQFEDDAYVENTEWVNPNLNSKFLKSTKEYDEQIKEKEAEKIADYSNKSVTEIKELQKELIAKGYDIGPTGADGDYGERTDEAYKNMRSDESLSPVNITKYYKNYDSSVKNSVENIQSMLVEKGFLPEKTKSGASNIDGKFGDLTREALQAYNSSGIQEDTKGMVFNNIPSEMDETRCSAGMCNILEMNNVETEELGVKYVDAWNMRENMIKKGNSEAIYNIYDNEAFANVNANTSAEDLVKITREVKRESQTKAGDYKTGDIIGIFWPGSGSHGETLNSETFNTHTGFVSNVIDGVPIITHNLDGRVVSQPYDQLITTWINRPKDDVVINTSYAEQADANEISNTEINPGAVGNLEKKLETKFSPKQTKVVSNIMQRARYNSKKIPEILNSSVDPVWLNSAIVAITGVESGAGLNAKRTLSEVKEWQDNDSLKSKGKKAIRNAAYKVKGVEDKDISLGVGKIKYSSIDNFSKSYFGINSPDDLADDNKSVDIISYRLTRNYEMFKDYSKQYPQLNLTEEDLRNMAILSHNQGNDLLLKLGRNKKNKLTPAQEVEALRSFYDGTITDITSTDYNKIPVFGRAAYNAALATGIEKPSEPYISKANRYIDEVYNYPNEGNMAFNKTMKEIPQPETYENGGWLDNYNK